MCSGECQKNRHRDCTENVLRVVRRFVMTNYGADERTCYKDTRKNP